MIFLKNLEKIIIYYRWYMRFDTDNIINNIIKDTFKNDNSKEQFYNIKQNKTNNICNNKHSPLLYEYDFSK